jgi:hypothetical protein
LKLNALTTAAALMFISLVGPPISEFNPENYVKQWLKKGHRHADYTSCPAPAGMSCNISNSENIWKIFQRYVKHVDFVTCFQNQSVYIFLGERKGKKKKNNIKALVKKILQL